MKWLNHKISEIVRLTYKPMWEERITALNNQVVHMGSNVINGDGHLNIKINEIKEQVMAADNVNMARYESVSMLGEELRLDLSKIRVGLEEETKNLEKLLLSISESRVGIENISDKIGVMDESQKLTQANVLDLLSRVTELEEIKDRLDDGIVLMTKLQLLELIERKIEVFEGNITNKISGLMTYVNDKTAYKPVVQDTELLKKLAKLEAVKDAVEHRRSSTEVLAEYARLKEQLLGIGREENGNVRLQERVETLKWVLGEI